jgi:hypothetical protein
MSESKKKKQFRLHCMFCGEAGSSREHYIPTWCHKYFDHLPNTIHPQSTNSLINPQSRTMHLDENNWTTGRARHTNPIRQVCGFCNERWMGEIVDAAKSAMERWAFPSGLAKSGQMSIQDRTTVAKWAVLCAITYQVAQQLHSILPLDIAHIYEKHEIPPFWRVAIAPVNIDAAHHALIAEVSATGRTPYGLNYSRGVSSFIIVLIDCVLVVWRTKATGTTGELWQNRKLHDIFPAHETLPNWEDMAPISGTEIDELIELQRDQIRAIDQSPLDLVVMNTIFGRPRRG